MPNLKIIIVGGGISGLTLANCLQHAGIDFVVLEGRSEIGLHVGAGVGIEPNGDRILDQLGIRDELLNFVSPYMYYQFRNVEGKFMYDMDAPQAYMRRTGYFLWTFDRKSILQAMYTTIWDKEKVLLGKRVEGIHYENSKPVVSCKDGTTYRGDVVVGADGVHSIVRTEMWRLAEAHKPHSISKEDKTYIFAEYRGLYGISDPIEGIDSSKFTMVVGKDEVCYFVGGKDHLLWVLAEKLPVKVCFPEIPRYTEEETLAFAKSKKDKPLIISNTTKITFGDIWEKKRIASLVSVQEGFLEQWTSESIVLIGDIVHKGTPETGQGANLAIETAASLANHLKRLAENSPEKISSADIRTCLRDFEEHRKPRARVANDKLMENVRVFTHSTPIYKFIIDYVSPRLGDIQTQAHADLFVGAERIEYLPIPAQSIGTQPFNPHHGIAKLESRQSRALTALPILAIALSSLFMTTDSSASSYSRGLELPVYLIWVLEAGRSANFLKPIQWTLLFGFLAHKFGLAFCGNVWFFLYYTWSPIEVYGAGDQRLFNIRYARSILPSLVPSAALPVLLSWSSVAEVPFTLLPASSSWWPTLILFTITQRFLMAFMTDTTPHDRLYNLKADLPYIRTITILATILSTIAFQTSGFQAELGITSPIIALSKIIEDPKILTVYIGALVWLALLYGDLKRARMAGTGWVSLLLCCATSTVLLGPGSTLLVGWAWREEVLATKQHWAAVTTAG